MNGVRSGGGHLGLGNSAFSLGLSSFRGQWDKRPKMAWDTMCKIGHAYSDPFCAISLSPKRDARRVSRLERELAAQQMSAKEKCARLDLTV